MNTNKLNLLNFARKAATEATATGALGNIITSQQRAWIETYMEKAVEEDVFEEYNDASKNILIIIALSLYGYQKMINRFTKEQEKKAGEDFETNQQRKDDLIKKYESLLRGFAEEYRCGQQVGKIYDSIKYDLISAGFLSEHYEQEHEV